MTPRGISAHLSKLEDAGYVEVTKEFLDRKPHTALALKKKGTHGVQRISPKKIKQFAGRLPELFFFFKEYEARTQRNTNRLQLQFSRFSRLAETKQRQRKPSLCKPNASISYLTSGFLKIHLNRCGYVGRQEQATFPRKKVKLEEPCSPCISSSSQRTPQSSLKDMASTPRTACPTYP